MVNYRMPASVFLLMVFCLPATQSFLYTNRWVVKSLSEADVKDFCNKYGFRFVRAIFDDYYSIQHEEVNIGDIEAHAMQDLLDTDNRILEASQLIHRPRKQRGLDSNQVDESEDNDRSIKLLYTDPVHNDQAWYMYKKPDSADLPGMNVDVAWRKGYTGKGIVVAVVDEGLFPENIDIAENFVQEASFSFVYNSSNLTPGKSTSHGTRCAGVIAAQANNSFCGVGIAHQAGIAGIGIPFNQELADDLEAVALTYALDTIDIYSNSWGPPINALLWGDAGPLMMRALELGVTTGRRGKGAIYVWASGNGGGFGMSCAYDGLLHNRFVIPVAGVRSDGRRLNTGESCSAIMVSTYGRTRQEDLPIVTTDGIEGKCVRDFRKSSATAPMVSAAAALALQANPYLTWRDMQHIIVQSSNSSVNFEPSDWIKNGAGFKVSPTFGFGLLNAGRMVELAERWLTIPNGITCVKSGHDVTQLPIQLDLVITDCPIIYLEHVQVSFNFSYAVKGYVGLKVISPAGTQSTLLPGLINNNQNSTFNWTVNSVHFWGEPVSNPNLPWILNFTKKFQDFNMSGELVDWKITYHGMELRPPFLTPECINPGLCLSKERCGPVDGYPIKSYFYWLISFCFGLLIAIPAACFCQRFGHLFCEHNCFLKRKSTDLPRTVSDDWHSEADDDSLPRSPPSTAQSQNQIYNNSTFSQKSFDDIIQNVIKPYLVGVMCCCLPNRRRRDMPPPPSANHISMNEVEVPAYEAPVPAVCSQNFDEPTQVYNIKNCKVQVIGNPSALQVFNLNKSVVSFANQEVTTDDPKSIVEMCDDCIVVNGQRQISFTRALSVCKSKVSYSEPTNATNQAVNVIKSSVHITINSDHYTADRSQIVNILDSNVCIEVKANCTGETATTRTIRISHSQVTVLIPMVDMTHSVISSGSSSTAVPENLPGPSTRESVEYATVRKEPKTGQTVVGPSYNSMINTLGSAMSSGHNGGYTPLNRVATELDRDEGDYCMPVTGPNAQGNHTLATVHSDKPVNSEIPLAQVQPYPLAVQDEQSRPAFQAYQRRSNSITEQPKHLKRVSAPEVPHRYSNDGTDGREQLGGPSAEPSNRGCVYTVPQYPAQNTPSGRPASAEATSNFNPYSQLIGPVAVPQTYRVPQKVDTAGRPRSQTDFNTNSRIYTGLTRSSPPQQECSPPHGSSLMKPPEISVPEEPLSPSQESPSHLETYTIPQQLRQLPVTNTAIQVNKPARASDSIYTVPQLPSSFRPIEKPAEQPPKSVEMPKVDPYSMKVHTEIDPISKEPLYAVPSTLQKKQSNGDNPPGSPSVSPLNTSSEFSKRSSESTFEGISPVSPNPDVFVDRGHSMVPPRPPRLSSSTSSEGDSADSKKYAKNVPTLKPRNRPLSVEIRCNNPKKKKNPRPISLPDDESVNDYEIPERSCTPEESVTCNTGSSGRVPDSTRMTTHAVINSVDNNGNTDNTGQGELRHPGQDVRVVT